MPSSAKTPFCRRLLRMIKKCAARPDYRKRIGLEILDATLDEDPALNNSLKVALCKLLLAAAPTSSPHPPPGA